MKSSLLPQPEDGVVLAGLKATPSGWPPASLDPASARHSDASNVAVARSMRSKKM